MTRLTTLPRLTVAAALLASSVFATATAQASLTATNTWSFSHNPSNGFLSEIVAFDDVNQQLWVAGVSGVDILNASTGAFVDRISITGGSINSVAIKNGVAAFAIESTTRTAPGRIDLYDSTSRGLLAGTNSIAVGALPDMVTFTPDGSKLLVANEATPNTYGSLTSAAGVYPKSYGPAATDPVGSVSIINMGSRSVVATANPNGVITTGSHIRTNTGMDFEPEYIAVNAAGTQAYVTLQEANAVGILDINSGSFTKVVGLGVKDFSLPGNQIDPSDKDGIVGNFQSVNVKGLYMPDSIAAYEANGQTFMVMANEGDAREDDGDLVRAGDLGAAAPLNRLRVSTTDSSPSDLMAFGARSFSIRDVDGNLVYDSGNILDSEAIALGIYDDARSDDKGVEPEGVEVMTIGGRTFAFVGLERTTTAAIGVFDISNPNNVSFVSVITNAGDMSPEGLKGFEMNGATYLAYSNEVSNTTSVFQLTAAAVPEPSTYALMLAGLGMIGLMRRHSLR